VDDIELLNGHSERLELGQGGRDPDGPELAADAASSEPRDVRVEAVDMFAQVQSRGAQTDALAHGDREVVVTVDQGRVAEDRPGAGDELIGGVGQDARPTAPADSNTARRARMK
jgi:hypothetical protein